MDIRLRSLAEQTIRLEDLDLEVEFAAGEEMRTEISTKFTRERLEAVYAEAGLEMSGWFTDDAGDYALCLAVPALGRQRLDQLAELVGRRDRREDRQRHAARDEGGEPLLHLLGRAEDEHLLDQVPGRPPRPRPGGRPTPRR